MNLPIEAEYQICRTKLIKITNLAVPLSVYAKMYKNNINRLLRKQYLKNVTSIIEKHRNFTKILQFYTIYIFNWLC